MSTHDMTGCNPLNTIQLARLADYACSELRLALDERPVHSHSPILHAAMDAASDVLEELGELLMDGISIEEAPMLAMLIAHTQCDPAPDSVAISNAAASPTECRQQRPDETSKGRAA